MTLDPVARVEVEKVVEGRYSETVRWRAKTAEGETVAVSETAWIVCNRHDRRKLVEWIRRLFPGAVLHLPWPNA